MSHNIEKLGYWDIETAEVFENLRGLNIPISQYLNTFGK